MLTPYLLITCHMNSSRMFTIKLICLEHKPLVYVVLVDNTMMLMIPEVLLTSKFLCVVLYSKAVRFWLGKMGTQ